MFITRFVLPLFLALTGLAFVATPLAENFVSHWFRRDVELRSTLIFQSVEYTLTELWNEGKKLDSYKKLFDNIARDERVLAVGICSIEGKLVVKSTQWPRNLDCPANLLTANPTFSVRHLENGAVLSGSFQLPVENVLKPHFVVLHDLGFALQRKGETRYYLIGFLVVVSFVAGLVTLLTAQFTMRSWVGRLRLTLSDPKARLSQQRLPREFVPIVREVRQMLREIKPGGFQLENIKVDWTPQKLNRLLKQELPDSEVIVVSNREPYIHNRMEGKITLQRPASGVVTALEPITRACKGTWIAHGSGTADHETADANDRLAVPPENPEYALRRVWLTQDEEEGYYYGLANEGLWPLCHITFVRPNFRESDWQTYKNVNRKFADAVVKEAKTKNPIVLVQDYHFAMLPRYVREALPEATIITFWHIPWPNPEVFSICPWREEILHGILGSSVLGFHTQFHCQNFMDSVDRFLESHINRDQSIITAGDHATLIRAYPISIAWPPEGLAGVGPAGACREAVRTRFGLKKDVRIGVGIERFDYTKGIIDRFLAIREFLILYPEWRERFCFIQAAAPTRSRLPSYQAIQRETQELADSINREFGNKHFQPIILLNRHHEPEEVFELFRAADFCTVSSLHDGMNLVAKEFSAARDDECGVLILSTFAGASKELSEALLVNPYDVKGMAQAMLRALMMPSEEQTERMRLLREMIRENNVYFWAARILLDAAHLRKRAHIERFISDSSEQKEILSNVVPLKSRS
jgi:trehalose 6-phosphate synthase/phosphatase